MLLVHLDQVTLAVFSAFPPAAYGGCHILPNTGYFLFYYINSCEDEVGISYVSHLHSLMINDPKHWPFAQLLGRNVCFYPLQML